MRIRRIECLGIGGYVERSAIELSDINVLCGPNGSGKSTWIQVLKQIGGLHSGDIPIDELHRERPQLLNWSEAYHKDGEERWATSEIVNHEVAITLEAPVSLTSHTKEVLEITQLVLLCHSP